MDIAPEISMALLLRIRNSWHEINKTYFRQAMKAPILTLVGPPTALGSYCAGTLYINPKLALWGSWAEDVIPTLKHEMAHQYLFEVLNRPSEGHGRLFRQVCQRLGIPSEASGILPTEAKVSLSSESDPTSQILRRIEKLLNLAQSDNLHEAEAAMAKANELLLRYNLDSTHLTGDFVRKNIATGKKRPPAEVWGATHLITSFYFVEIITFKDWDKDGCYTQHLAFLGRSANVTIAEYVFHYLVPLAKRLWEESKNPGDSRQAFMWGIFDGLQSKLKEQQKANQKRGLIWKGDAELIAFSRRCFPHVRTGKSYARTSSESYGRGKSLGKTITIHKGIHHRHSGEQRLLK